MHELAAWLHTLQLKTVLDSFLDHWTSKEKKRLSQELERKMGSKTTYTKLLPNRKICQIKTLKKEKSEL
jgi:hypothetical protein